jgi:hypothetical protein
MELIYSCHQKYENNAIQYIKNKWHKENYVCKKADLKVQMINTERKNGE